MATVSAMGRCPGEEQSRLTQSNSHQAPPQRPCEGAEDEEHTASRSIRSGEPVKDAGATGSARRARAERRLRARRSSADSPPQTPASWPDSMAHFRQASATSHRRQMALASSVWRSVGAVFPNGKNNWGSSSRQAAWSRHVIRIELLASRTGVSITGVNPSGTLRVTGSHKASRQVSANTNATSTDKSEQPVRSGYQAGLDGSHVLTGCGAGEIAATRLCPVADCRLKAVGNGWLMCSHLTSPLVVHSTNHLLPCGDTYNARSPDGRS
jgi:hypothetical protein